jgi:hypothetical protein
MHPMMALRTEYRSNPRRDLASVLVTFGYVKDANLFFDHHWPKLNSHPKKSLDFLEGTRPTRHHLIAWFRG